jgi:hypothetical protein
MRLLNYTYNSEEDKVQSLIPKPKQYRDILTSFLDEAEPFDIFMLKIKEQLGIKLSNGYFMKYRIKGGISILIKDGYRYNKSIDHNNNVIKNYTFLIKEGDFILWSYSISSYIGFYNFQMTLWYKTGITFATYYSFENDYFWYPPFIAERTEWDITGGNYDYYL